VGKAWVEEREQVKVEVKVEVEIERTMSEARS
jgi:hypothetical protein